MNPKAEYKIAKSIVDANLRIRDKADGRAEDALTEIRAMSESARRSIGQKIRYARAAVIKPTSEGSA